MYRSTFVLSFKYINIFTLSKVQKYLLISSSPQSSNMPTTSRMQQKNYYDLSVSLKLMKHGSFERLLNKCSECVSNDRWGKCLLYHLYRFLFVYVLFGFQKQYTCKVNKSSLVINKTISKTEIFHSCQRNKHDSFERM